MGKRIITGIRSNGELHLGNYIGAMQAMAQLQASLSDDDELLMFIPDLHSFTTPVEHDELYKNSLKNVRMFIAGGVDPNNQKTTIWRQSFVSAHSELTVILNNFTYFGEAQRMTQFKDKSEKLGHKAVTIGLFDYPVMMASDILLYGANYVPLGDDQKQHMELTRDLSIRFNNKFGDIFTIPEPWDKQLEFAKREVSIRIMSLAEPTNKMSKSIDDPRGTINLSENPDEAAKKVMSATTDSEGSINYNPSNQPGISNLLEIGALLGDESIENYSNKWQGQSSYGDLKKEVSERVKQFLVDFQSKYDQISEEQVIQILESGEVKASQIANETLKKVQKAVGIR